LSGFQLALAAFVSHNRPLLQVYIATNKQAFFVKYQIFQVNFFDYGDMASSFVF